MSRKEYKTSQRALMIEAIEKLGGNFKVFDLEKALFDKVSSITIYRQIKKMLEEGKLQKREDGTEVNYCYVGGCSHDEHFYLFCKDCGKMTHLDCNCLMQFCQKIKNDHSFEVENKNMIISGRCHECIQKKK